MPRTKTEKWIRPRSRCPSCNKGPAVRIDPQLSRLLGYFAQVHGAEGDALSVKCNRCRTVFKVPISAIVTAPE